MWSVERKPQVTYLHQNNFKSIFHCVLFWVWLLLFFLRWRMENNLPQKWLPRHKSERIWAWSFLAIVEKWSVNCASFPQIIQRKKRVKNRYCSRMCRRINNLIFFLLQLVRNNRFGVQLRCIQPAVGRPFVAPSACGVYANQKIEEKRMQSAPGKQLTIIGKRLVERNWVSVCVRLASVFNHQGKNNSSPPLVSFCSSENQKLPKKCVCFCVWIKSIYNRPPLREMAIK